MTRADRGIVVVTRTDRLVAAVLLVVLAAGMLFTSIGWQLQRVETAELCQRYHIDPLDPTCADVRRTNP